jgi:hypothetical protein
MDQAGNSLSRPLPLSLSLPTSPLSPALSPTRDARSPPKKGGFYRRTSIERALALWYINLVKKKNLGKGDSDSQHFKGLKRGDLRAFWDLKTENGVFFGQKSFLTQFSLFFLEF